MYRFDCLIWQTDLRDEGIVVCAYERKGGWNLIHSTCFSYLEAIKPFIRGIIETPCAMDTR